MISALGMVDGFIPASDEKGLTAFTPLLSGDSVRLQDRNSPCLRPVMKTNVSRPYANFLSQPAHSAGDNLADPESTVPRCADGGMDA